MKIKSIFLCLLFMFVKMANSYSQILITDTLAKKYYIKYQLDENTRTKNGTYEMIYKNKTLTKGNYKNNNRTGVWEFTGMNDTLQEKGSYVDGYKDGVWESYYSDGKLSSKMSYKHGKKDGVFKGYFKNGNVSFESSFVNDSAQGVSTEYYESGKIERIDNYLGDSLNGLTKRYYENGTLKEQKYMKGDNRDSIYLFYYDDGSLWEHILYRSGSPYNVIAYNDVNGKPIDCCTIKDGNGIMRFYDKEKRVTEEKTYVNSVKNGHAKYLEKGIVTGEGNYLNGLRDGVWLDNYESGELYSKINYVKGLEEGDGIYYSKKGNVIRKGLYVNDESSGLWTNYDDDGNIASEQNYKEGILDGEAKYYYNGKMTMSGKYNKGKRIFTWTYYNTKGKITNAYDYGYTFVSKNERKQSFDDAPKKNKEIPLTITEQMPEFPGGVNMMMEFIQKNIIYPKDAIDANMSGTVYVNFVVDNTGEITDPIILRGVLNSLDDEALRVVESMPRWSPGLQNGRPVAVSFNLPIKYALK